VNIRDGDSIGILMHQR